MKFKVLLICMLAAVFSSHATKPNQHTFNYISIAVNNYITAKPFNGFPKLFYSQFHPGLTVSSKGVAIDARGKAARLNRDLLPPGNLRALHRLKQGVPQQVGHGQLRLAVEGDLELNHRG